MMKLLAILIVVCLVGVYGFIQSGIYNVAATVKDGPLITWVLHTTMEKSVKRRAQNIEVPDITNDEIIFAGLSDYAGMCAQCHGEPGIPPGIVTQGLNPAPPDLEHLVEAGTAAEMFWIINNGIRMTGMPAFGKTHQPDEIWPVVAFLQSTKNITPSDYNKMKIKAESYGHHKTESSMGNEESEQHHAEGENAILGNNDQILKVPSSSQEVEDHSNHSH